MGCPGIAVVRFFMHEDLDSWGALGVQLKSKWPYTCAQADRLGLIGEL